MHNNYSLRTVLLFGVIKEVFDDMRTRGMEYCEIIQFSFFLITF
jgi:hypothetical protein